MHEFQTSNGPIERTPFRAAGSELSLMGASCNAPAPGISAPGIRLTFELYSQEVALALDHAQQPAIHGRPPTPFQSGRHRSWQLQAARGMWRQTGTQKRKVIAWPPIVAT